MPSEITTPSFASQSSRTSKRPSAGRAPNIEKNPSVTDATRNRSGRPLPVRFADSVRTAAHDSTVRRSWSPRHTGPECEPFSSTYSRSAAGYGSGRRIT